MKLTVISRLFALSLTVLTMAPAFAELTDDQLVGRLEELAPLAKTGLDLAALERESAYEKAGVPVEQRAEFEAQLLIEQIRKSVVGLYYDALAQTGEPAAAREEVKSMMLRDLEKLDLGMREAMRTIVEEILRDPAQQSSELDVPASLLLDMKAQSENRLAILAQGQAQSTPFTQLDDRLDPNSRANQTVHKTKEDFIEAMTDDQSQSERWVSTANTAARSGVSRGHEEEISAQVAVEFLGVKVSAGPKLKFKRFISTYVDIKGEGLYPLFDDQGRFDLVLRDRNGQPRKSRSGSSRRFVFFTCEVEAFIESEAGLGGGFKVMGIGAEGSVIERYTNSVNMASRRVLVPDSVAGRTVTLGVLSSMCHRDFIAARASNRRTVKQNLDSMTRSLLASVMYVNPALKCVTNNHCVNWYNREVLGIHKYKTVPRCIQENGNPGVMSCQLRGGAGANCKVVRNNKVVSSGYFEYTCDTGKRCVVTQQGGWGGFLNIQWTPWVGQCR